MSRGHSPSSGISEIVAAVQRAGYDPANEREFNFGLIAYNTAQLLYAARLAAVHTASERARPATGRNRPCPCGSGKKYKLCCLVREPSRKTESPKSPTDEPALIPRLDDVAAMMRDMDILAGLLETDPVLCEIRFDRSRCVEFLELNTPTAHDDEERQEQLDEVAQHYFLEVEDGKLPGDIVNKLREAAVRVPGSDELRSLALGVIFGMTTETMDDGPNPLVSVLFRLSVKDVMSSYQAIEDIVERLGGRKAIADRLMTSDPGLNREIGSLAAALKPEERRALEGVFYDNIRDIEKTIDEGRFPVYLSLASVLPLLADLGRFAPRNLTRSEIQAVFAAAIEGLGEEDVRVFVQLLREWLDADGGEDEEVTSMVRMVFGLASGGSLGPLAWHLLLASIQHDVNGVLPGEEELLANIEGDILEPASLERYADFLDSKGYGALAQRTRRLASCGGP